MTACLIVFVRVHCILNALSRELTICAVESQTDYLPCLGSQYPLPILHIARKSQQRARHSDPGAPGF